MPRKPNPDRRRCGAETRAGTPCRQWAVRGRRRCRMHGGGSPKRERAGRSKRPGRPISHGAYSKAELRNVWDTLDELQNDVAVTSLQKEILYLKDRLRTLLSSTSDHSDPKLVRVKADGSVEDIAGALCERIGRLVTRWHNMVSRDEFLMSVTQLEPVVRAVDQVFDEFVPECDLERARQSLTDRLRSILLPPDGAQPARASSG